MTFKNRNKGNKYRQDSRIELPKSRFATLASPGEAVSSVSWSCLQNGDDSDNKHKTKDQDLEVDSSHNKHDRS